MTLPSATADDCPPSAAHRDGDPCVDVVHFQRLPRSHGNYSLEAIFEDVRQRLQPLLDIRLHVAPCLSNGVLPRLRIMLDAWRHQGRVNHITGDINFAGLLLPRRRTVLTMLDCGDLRTRHDWAGWVLRQLWVRWPARHAAVVTCISHATRDDVIALSGCDPAKVVVIPVAISPQYQPSPKAFNAERPRLLQVGTAHNKNIPRLIAALEGIPCTLVIVGRLDDDIQQALDRHQVPFENLRNLSSEALLEQYHLADIITFASTFEGFGMPILEGQSVGRPVLTSRISSMPEVAGGAACLVDPFDVASIRDGLLSLIQQPDLRERLVQAGFENAKRFQPDEIARQYLDVYWRLGATPRPVTMSDSSPAPPGGSPIG
jgi:glycosyltransferase involved in cell wall biosynthesis